MSILEAIDIDGFLERALGSILFGIVFYLIGYYTQKLFEKDYNPLEYVERENTLEYFKDWFKGIRYIQSKGALWAGYLLIFSGLVYFVIWVYKMLESL